MFKKRLNLEETLKLIHENSDSENESVSVECYSSSEYDTEKDNEDVKYSFANSDTTRKTDISCDAISVDNENGIEEKSLSEIDQELNELWNEIAENENPIFDYAPKASGLPDVLHHDRNTFSISIEDQNTSESHDDVRRENVLIEIYAVDSESEIVNIVNEMGNKTATDGTGQEERDLNNNVSGTDKSVVTNRYCDIEENHIQDLDELGEDVIKQNTNTKETNHADIQVRSRKRKRNVTEWKQTVRKRLRQSGQEYLSCTGKRMRARKIKYQDCGACKHKCNEKLSPSDRKRAFDHFWNLSDSEKNVFYSSTTEKNVKKRSRTNASSPERRKYTLKYYLLKGEERVQVCRSTYLRTLDINEKRIRVFYNKCKNQTQYADKRGSHRQQRISGIDKERIRDHIKAFPTMPSHYNRANSSKTYLETGLTLVKMYSLYKEKCYNDSVTPLAVHQYRHIFNSEFNIAFHVPKKDRCDICMEQETQTSNRAGVSKELESKYEQHQTDKNLTYQERHSDRNSDAAVICFDMQNVITCPRANVSNFYYKRKLNMYNLTAHCSMDKVAYNVVWNETQAGRGSNEIASGLVQVLKAVSEDYPLIDNFTLWSDSCVPQNRNSVMCYTLKHFLSKSPSVQGIVQKFCTPGHSSIQEVDNVHSHIERAFKNHEIYSPLGVLNKLKTVRKQAMKIIQLKREHILDYKQAASTFRYDAVPFSSVKYVEIRKDLPHHVIFKLSFDSEPECAPIQRKTRRGEVEKAPVLHHMRVFQKLSKEKKKDLESMMKFFPDDDKLYMEKICKLGASDERA